MQKKDIFSASLGRNISFMSKLLLNRILKSQFDLVAWNEPILCHVNPQKQQV